MGDDKYYIPERPTSARGFEPPVSWLLGPQLVAALRGIALHALYRSKLDLRDWMRPADWTAPLAAGAEEQLTPDELLGHVIAVDRPQPDGKLLRPRLVERFTVRPRKTTPSEAPAP